MAHDTPETSVFFDAWRDALAGSAATGPGLDLACGYGRHARALSALGVPCIGIDRDRAALAGLRGRRGVLPVLADVETGHGLPLRTAVFGSVLVFRFLFRPLCDAISAALAPGGLLLYETFTVRQRDLGHGPRNPAFLLQPGELPGLFPRLEVEQFEEGVFAEDGAPKALARLAARRPR